MNETMDSSHYEFKHLPPIMDKEMVEILRDGKPFFEELPFGKKHFQFGKEKAKMLCACLPDINMFYVFDGNEPATTPKTIYNGEFQKRCEIIRYEGFTKYGRWYEMPYLELRELSLSKHPRVLRFGLKKAEAIINLKDNICRFASKLDW